MPSVHPRATHPVVAVAAWLFGEGGLHCLVLCNVGFRVWGSGDVVMLTASKDLRFWAQSSESCVAGVREFNQLTAFDGNLG